MEGSSGIESEVKSWLQIILKQENLKNLSVNVLGNSEKGDGYLGDVVFVNVSGVAESGSTRKYNLVLKCSKQSQVLREKSITKEAFLNEVYIYNTLMPFFTQFQHDKMVEECFDSIPKCYGTYTGENMEVIALANLNELGYSLWEKKKPLPITHINKVVKEYAKFHAVSIAIQHQQPKTFEGFEAHLENILKRMRSKGNPIPLIRNCIEEVYHLLKNDLQEDILDKWRNLTNQVDFIFGILETADVKVVAHGDCWNNNFMYFYDEIDKNDPAKLAILDWQMSKFLTPIADLSYFLFACISEDDLEDMETILENYHNSFSKHLIKLGTDPNSVYTFHQFLEDWRKYYKFGIVMSSFILKICSTEKDEVIDIGEAAEQGVDFFDSFLHEIKDTSNFKNRIKPIVQYAAQHGLI